MVPNRATHPIYTIENTKMEQQPILNGRWPIKNILFVTYFSPVLHFIRKLAKQVTGFYVKCNTALKWIKQSSFLVHENKHIKNKNCIELFWPCSFKPLTILENFTVYVPARTKIYHSNFYCLNIKCSALFTERQ